MQKNRIELAGYLATRPDARFLPSGTKVVNVRLRESYRFNGTDRKEQTHTNWHSLVFYGELADVALQYDKSDNIYVEGSLQQRKFTPSDGVARTVYEIHVRSCHQIAAPQLNNEKESAPEEPEKGTYDDPSWPVGPA
jgi:single-strand DNA-binding protein